MSNAKKVKLINQTSVMKGGLRKRLKPFNLDFGLDEYHKLNRANEK